jgi:hypothetical protein
MDRRSIPWRAEWRASGLNPGPLSAEEEALVPALQEENRRFLEDHPFRPKGRPQTAFRMTAWAVPLAVAAALVFVLSGPGSPLSPPEAGGERLKGAGDPVLVVYRQGPTGPERLVAQAHVKPGDVLQAAYQVARPVQGALLSVDGSGNVTVHLAQKNRSVPLVPGAEHPLAFSYELDQAPRFEVFFLFTGDQVFDVEPLRQTLKSTPWETLKPGAFGSSVRFTVLALVKGATR